jgi:hypothetical protein
MANRGCVEASGEYLVFCCIVDLCGGPTELDLLWSADDVPYISVNIALCCMTRGEYTDMRPIDEIF